VANRRRRRLLWKRGTACLLLAFSLCTGESIGDALNAPGTDTTAARLAEWGRGHFLGWAVTGLEHVQYAADKPAVGGVPAGGIPTAAVGHRHAAARAGTHAGVAASPRHRTSVPAAPTTTPAPAPLAAQMHPALPREGRWQTSTIVDGRAAIREAFLRPDAVRTSYLVGVAWLDQRLVRFVLHPGTLQPGGTGWSEEDQVPTKGRDRLLATFNSGFRLADAHGGYWQAGKLAGSLRTGAASLVVYRDGHVDVGQWGRDVRLSSDVVAVRQNLDLLVDGGRLSPEVGMSNTRAWGVTVGDAAYVWRSAVGIRGDGSIVFVAGNALSVASLGRIMQDAGAVRAMELDINRDWTSFMTYAHAPGNVVTPRLLTSDEHPNPYRYLSPSSRDFVAVYRR
jgi:phosphodiester glycosidase